MLSLEVDVVLKVQKYRALVKDAYSLMPNVWQMMSTNIKNKMFGVTKRYLGKPQNEICYCIAKDTNCFNDSPTFILKSEKIYL